MSGIAAWLQGLGLGQYEQAFRTNDIDADLLPTLTEQALRELGIVSLIHRKRLLAVIAALAGPEEPQPVPPVPPGLGQWSLHLRMDARRPERFPPSTSPKHHFADDVSWNKQSLVAL